MNMLQIISVESCICLFKQFFKLNIAMFWQSNVWWNKNAYFANYFATESFSSSEFETFHTLTVSLDEASNWYPLDYIGWSTDRHRGRRWVRTRGGKRSGHIADRQSKYLPRRNVGIRPLRARVRLFGKAYGGPSKWPLPADGWLVDGQ